MKYRNFSNLGWQISEIGLGCWAIGSEWGDDEGYKAKVLQGEKNKKLSMEKKDEVVRLLKRTSLDKE